MWLIDTTDLVLKFVSTEQSRKPNFAYAILSHTWGDDEVLFEEMRQGRGAEKRGWFKIVQTCQQAQKDGLWWAWVDSCCINKESSAELSEAINSMWQWYCGATICYTYLEDFETSALYLMDANNPDLDAGHNDEDRRISEKFAVLHKEFASSRWFTRGWTLQELIAPKTLHFYDRHWTYVGTKEQLIHTIHRITKIGPLTLETRSALQHYVAARKMSWAANRQTTRVEDRAYSLLGIFGVNLPLLYGEGDRAFVRLQEEILRTSTDHSILAWDGLAAAERAAVSQSVRISQSAGTYEPARPYSRAVSIMPPEDMIFARSPDQFLSGHRIVGWRGDRVDRPFRLTNTGISFDSLPVVQGASGYFAILNCRYEDDFSGELVLRICQIDSLIENEVIEKDAWWVPIDWLRPPFDSRVVVQPHSVGGEEPSQPATLLRQHPASQSLSRENFDFWPKIWVRNAVETSEQVDLVDAYPRDVWNLDTGVMCPRESRRVFEQYRVTASFALRGVRSNWECSIAFMVEYTSRGVDAALVEPDISLFICSGDQKEARKSLKYVDPGKDVALDFGSGLKCFVRALPAVEMLGAVVIRIEVGIKEVPP